MEQFFEEIFEKAQEETHSESLRGRCEHIAEVVLEEFKYSLSYKTLERYYKGETSPKGETRDVLARYLGYERYKDYLRKDQDSNAGEQPIRIKGRKISIMWLLIGLLPAIFGAGYLGYIGGKETCMTWKGDHYERTECNGSPGEEALNNYKLENFRQIQVNDTTAFFKNGKVQVWYDKTDNVLTYFSAPGSNPETGKTVKAITEYMIRKYIRTE